MVNRKRREVYNRDDVFTEVKKELKKYGVNISIEDLWLVFRVSFRVIAELGKHRWVSLMTLGTFKVEDSQRSIKLGRPAKRLRYKASSTLVRDLNSGKSMLRRRKTISEESEERNIVGSIVEAKVKELPKPVAVKKEVDRGEIVKKVQKEEEAPVTKMDVNINDLLDEDDEWIDDYV